jgi:hypothetical protein
MPRTLSEAARRKGMAALQRARAEGKRPATRKQRMAAYASSFAGMRSEFPRWVLPLIGRAEQGSLPASIQLKCLECSSWHKVEIRDCVIPSCPLYPHRPYQGLKGRNSNDPPLDQPTPTPEEGQPI